jgi:hypothetical protein
MMDQMQLGPCVSVVVPREYVYGRDGMHLLALVCCLQDILQSPDHS